MFKTTAEAEQASFAVDAQFQEVHQRLRELMRQRDALEVAKNPGLLPYLEKTLEERRVMKPEDVAYLEEQLARARQELQELEALDAQILDLQQRRDALLQEKAKIAQELERLVKEEQQRRPPSESTTVITVEESIVSQEALGVPGKK